MHPKKIVIIIVKIGLHVDTEAIRKQTVTFLLRWLLSGTIFPHRSLLNIVINKLYISMIVPFKDLPLIFLELTGAFCFHRHQRGPTREGDQRAS